MTTVQRSLVPSLFRTTVIRADNTLLKCLRLLYFHGGCARASLSDFLPSAAHFRYFTLCCMHAYPRLWGCPIGNASAHSSTGAPWPRSRLAARQMLNPWTQGHLDPLDVICTEFDSISGGISREILFLRCFPRLDVRSWVVEYVWYSFFIDFCQYIYIYMIFYEMKFMTQNMWNCKKIFNIQDIEEIDRKILFSRNLIIFWSECLKNY